jgi:tRNA(Arg) A34 adenosine deaminase TadA
MDVWYYLRKAADAASRERDDPRCHAHGALAIRDDKTIVFAKNGFSQQKQPESHAERRVLRKCDKGSIVFVVRIRKNFEMGMSRPCPMCDAAMRVRGVKRVYYSISNSEYGVIDYER